MPPECKVDTERAFAKPIDRHHPLWKAQSVGLGSAYFTPISPLGHVVEKRVLAVDVEKDRSESEEPSLSELRVVYELTNPYAYPVPVPIQSGLALLYQFGDRGDRGRKPELHVVPSTVTDQSHGELLYVADDTAGAVGTAAVQRLHVGTGVPNYRHALAVNRTLVPGSTLRIEARASVPDGVNRMILVDAMVGPDRPYGLYPQLLDDEAEENQIPPAIRVYDGAEFDEEQPRVRLPDVAPAGGLGTGPAERGGFLPRWISRERFDQLRRALSNQGMRQLLFCAATGVLLSSSMLARYAIAGNQQPVMVEAGRIVAIIVLSLLLGGGLRGSRWVLGAAYLLSGLFSLVQVLSLVLDGAIDPVFLLTEVTVIPILYVMCSAIILLSPAVRALTQRSNTHNE